MKKKFHKTSVAVLLAGFMTTSALAGHFLASAKSSEELFANSTANSVIRELKDLKVDFNSATKSYLNKSVAYQLPETVADEEIISVIVKMDTDTVLDAYDKTSKNATLAEYMTTKKAKGVRATNDKAKNALVKALNKANVAYTLGVEYDLLLSGFELEIQAKDFQLVNTLVETAGATAIVGEVYAPAETKLVTNDVNVYETGIFNSAGSGYDGTGTVVAVLDTGFDYTHSAYSADNFNPEGMLMDKAYIDGKVADLKAADLTAGLTVEDVYMNAKIPYAYDYADKDTDVYPIRSNHGTHVAGIIAGNNYDAETRPEGIVGAAPNAQLALMKVFSEAVDGAKDSWLLGALEDCVVLGVDVINMSLGTGAGFTREEDEKEMMDIYDSIKARGISLIASAANSYNSTFGSTKNGNLGLTSNPDSATVGSPSTYDSALSVASIGGVKTPYLLYGEQIIYFTESTDGGGEQKKFVDELLPEGETEKVYDYVTVPGIGLKADYTGLDVTGKIALVKRGTSSFEDKARIASRLGAAGVIIYNNVSGDISMTVGNVDAAVCSISQADGEVLAAQLQGKIKLSRDQVAGPFMSDFSSWGPTPSLGIKPEITAHGGDIYSSVPGEAYDVLSGTSMAAPNQAGITALIRQYVKENADKFAIKDGRTGEIDPVKLTARVNQIMMSTTDVAYNKNGLPYAVRKQGAGLANLTKVTTTSAYLTTFDKYGEMDKAKLELGDDKDKTGVYTLTFNINNVSDKTLEYDVNAVVMTEGVSDVKTHQGDTTVTQEGYLLEGASVVVTDGAGDGSYGGNVVTVDPKGCMKVTVTITLSEEDKAYMDEAFKNGMYVEGFVTLKSKSGDVDLNIPYLAFYGDWTQAPIFDLEYFETNKDELDDSIDTLDKTMADGYPTTPIGGLYDDYINYLGSYYFIQDPNTTQISATKDHISLSNQSESVNSIYAVWAGMLRGAKRIETTITEDATGKVVYTQTDYDVIKSFNRGGQVAMSSIKYDFATANYNLKNNTKYTVKLQAFVDYGDGGVDTNARNTFEFPFTTDFQAPTITDCTFYTEYDKSTKKTKLFAQLQIYDNHYAMALYGNRVYLDTNDEGEKGLYLDQFSRYPTPIYSDFNSTTTVTYELTDYIEKCTSAYNRNTQKNDGSNFVVAVYDYAMNMGTYEIAIPDDIRALYFEETELTLRVNETYQLEPKFYPTDQWAATLLYESSAEDIVRVVNGQLLAVAPGTATITATSKTYADAKAVLTVTVADPTDPNYPAYDKPVVADFDIPGYTTDKAYHFNSSADREIGVTGQKNWFTGGLVLSMYPSEAVTLDVQYKEYFPDSIEVVYTSNNDKIATIDENGKITALAEGIGSVDVKLLFNGEPTFYSKTIAVSVKDPYETNSGYLMSYRGLGGKVEIPEELTIRLIYQYAFSNYDYIPKDENDEISEEDPSKTKIWYIGDDTITEVIIPEGVEEIGSFAFANLTALESVTLPSTLTKIGDSAFLHCTSLKTVNGLEHVQFVNQNAFKDCAISSVNFSKMVALGDYAFENNNIPAIYMPSTMQSIGAGAFKGNAKLKSVEIEAPEVKIGKEVFSGCELLEAISINAAVIPEQSFFGCTALSSVTIGKKVAVIGPYAFAGTNVSEFTVDAENATFAQADSKQYLVDKATKTTVLLGVPKLANKGIVFPSTITTIGKNAFTANESLESIGLPNVTKVEEYAFADCRNLDTVLMGDKVASVGDFAFAATALTAIPFPSMTEVGNRAFMLTDLTSVSIPNDVTVGDYAFAQCYKLATVTIGNDVTLGEGVFYSGYNENYQSYSAIKGTVKIGKNVTIGDAAFFGAGMSTVELGAGAKIGNSAFFFCTALTSIDLSKATEIGNSAFSGFMLQSQDSSGNVTYKYAAAPLYTVDLSSVTKLGEGAFTYCVYLSEVSAINEELSDIPSGAFMYTSLTSFDFSDVKSIGIYSFAATGLRNANLSKVNEIGLGAFYANENLQSVTLKRGVKIGHNAFTSAKALTKVTNLAYASSIGSYAFAGTALTEADLSNVGTIGDFAFFGTKLESVKLGAALANLGENPFAATNLPEFTMVNYDEFNGQKFEVVTNTFDFNEFVKVIDGALYRVTAKGDLELITYPTAKKDSFYNVAEGTVRIGAYAFYGSTLTKVELPYELQAIGHMAFYGMEKLSVVAFHSLVAPVLEEEYDTNYQLITSIPHVHNGYESMGEQYKGLDISPYYIWNISATNFYYGANFVSYIGRFEPTLTMIRPKNGTLYDTYIYGHYFASTVIGKAEADELTLAAAAAIKAIPEKSAITLDDKATVEAARAAYNLVFDHDQLAILTEQGLATALTDAEYRIYKLENPDSGEPEPTPVEKEDKDDNSGVVIVISVVIGALILIGATAIFVIRQLKAKKAEAKNVEEVFVDDPVETTEEEVSAKETPAETEEKDAE